MKKVIQTSLPATNLALREEIFNGSAFIDSATSNRLELVDAVLRDLKETLAVSDIRRAHLELGDEEFFLRMGELRRHFFLEPEYHDRLRTMLAEVGFDPDRCAFDPLRIRVILPGGHDNPKAAPVYYAHRDTWYAHPQCLIVGWMPLHDLRAEETFEFYPEYFDQAVPNDSEIFDYADWVKDGPALKIGWQKSDSGLTAGYPRSLLEKKPEVAEGFEIARGDLLLFAGSHFHQTREQDFGTIRYSLDFRVVQLDDIAAQRGAPNVDNRSRGNILADYVQPLS